MKQLWLLLYKACAFGSCLALPSCKTLYDANGRDWGQYTEPGMLFSPEWLLQMPVADAREYLSHLTRSHPNWPKRPEAVLALNGSCTYRDADFTRILLEAGIDPNRTVYGNPPPLLNECMETFPDIETLRLLLQAGARADVWHVSPIGVKTSAVGFCMLTSNPDMVALLLQHGGKLPSREDMRFRSFYENWDRVQSTTRKAE